ncbi:hypothetical protein ACHAXA_004822 [Cyclostephanos tholiformis]|uniref:AFG1-like ATPase n=1 Tax=Cyclostephanos tholiformis TaxID=382380 RepID=A0ABD3SGL6_9STRA
MARRGTASRSSLPRNRPLSISTTTTRPPPVHGVSRDDDDGGSTASIVLPLDRWLRMRVDGGTLLHDDAQLHAASGMTRLQMALMGYDHGAYMRELKSPSTGGGEEYQLRRRRRRLECNDERRRSEEGVTYDGEEEKEEEEDDDDDVSHRRNADERSTAHATTNMPIPRGFYLYGNVGTGKSLLLDGFYEVVTVHGGGCATGGKKVRVHFHAFLREIHRRIHDLNGEILRAHGRNFRVDTSGERNPIIRVASRLSREITLLCLDEFQVTDVADAVIMRQFFGELWRNGVVVVTTSNRHPRELYEGGLNREYFLPFIDMLEKYCVVHHLVSDDGEKKNASFVPRDYRRIRSGVDVAGSDKKCGEYYHLNRPGERRNLDRLFRSHRENSSSTNACDDRVPPPLALPVNFRRKIQVARYHSRVVALFTFDELCTTDLGSSDYHAIANHFRIVMIEDIPKLTLTYPDTARRFITLIDELYEAGCCLACTAVDIPDRLFVGKSIEGDDGSDGSNSSSVSADEVAIMNAREILAVDVAQARGVAVGESASVRELSFAFGRATSRLLEMCSKTWWEERGVSH